MKRILPTIVFVVIAVILTSFIPNTPANGYVDKYSELAVVEMYRSGIPASIILAQGLHESQNGISDLAVLANNHFGIKCKSYWQGESYYHKDDDYKNGALIKSCFRKYNSDIDSYVDHTNYLVKTRYYTSLFDYTKTDYINWAHGLEKCGYATDPMYAEKLIKKIEKYRLYEFDYYTNPYNKLK